MRVGTLALVAIAAGLAIGVLTQFAQGWPLGPYASLANAGAPWVVVAYIVGRRARARRAACALGTVAILGELIGYYVAATIELGYPPAWSLALLWTIVALVAGPLVGWAGWLAAHGYGQWSLGGNALLGGVFIGEGLYLATVVALVPAGVTWIVVGFLGALALNWRSSRRVLTVTAPIAIGLAIYAAYLGLLLLDRLRALFLP